WTYLADKRIVARTWKGSKAGEIVRDVVDSWLAEEGVTYSADVTRTEDSQAEFEQGTLVRTKATARGLELDTDYMLAAVGDNGTILTSPDGVTWTSRSSGTMQHLRGITHGGGLWVAVGFSGTILTSSDGTTWTSRSSETTQILYGVAYGGGMWVVVGAAG